MRILALETSGLAGSVALADGDRLLCELDLPAEMRTAQALAPTIETALHEAGWRAEELQLIVVTQGPGSFTGLRVGVTTAKTMAYALGTKVLGLDTLETIAQQAPSHVVDLEVALDAQRRQLFTAAFQRDEKGNLMRTRPTAIMDYQQWLSQLAPGTAVLGAGVKCVADRLSPSNVIIASDGRPRASTVAALGWRDFQSGRRDDVWKFTPNYYRPSYAEETRK